jgi:decaprenylphospho-beta-D-erythro-pentofuranosid-2-ulose 2-reductase
MRVLVLGATSAIAQAAARIWAARGDELLLVARSADRLAAVAGDLRTRGGKVETFVQDLNDAALYGPLVERAGRLDLVLLAQGLLGDPADADPAAVELVFRTNLVGPAQLLTLIGQRLQPGACIAAISSVAGDRGRAKNGIYGAAKAGLDAFLSAQRQELSKRGVRVVTVKPGFVDTPMTAALPRSPLFASAESVGRGIARAAESGGDVVYLPWYWRFIMLVVRALPERIFKRLSF